MPPMKLVIKSNRKKKTIGKGNVEWKTKELLETEI